MENEIWEDLKHLLRNYESTVSSINKIIAVYETDCINIIEDIKKESFEGAQKHFDRLHSIQEKLSMAKYKFGYNLSEKIDDFVYKFDRDDIYSREYWYKKFKEGFSWPNE